VNTSTEKTTNPVSVVLITLNAARQLEACLASVSTFADEIVLVDSGSTDNTTEIAEQFGANVIQQSWLGFGAQKQFAVEQARNDWVLCLDADERVSSNLQASIIQLLATQPSHQAYCFPRCNKFMDRYLRYGEGYPDLSLRLFNRKSARWSDDEVHEKVLVNGEVGQLSGDLLHDSAETIDSYLTKQNRYTSLAAKEALAKGKKATLIQLLLSPLVRFIKFYFLRQGFRDGTPGLVHILIGCFNSFSKYAKMLDKKRTE
jgi:glycosyltransferase involved in cell wall biosynthesis